MTSYSALVEAKKNLLLGSYLYFISYFFGIVEKAQFIISKHHILVADTLNDVLRGDIRRLIINIPPGYSKTEMAVIGFISYCMAKYPHSRFIHLSYSDSLALLNSQKIRDIVLLDEFQELWPLQIKHDTRSKKRWNIAEYGGGVYATSTGGQITGFRAGRPGFDEFNGAIIIDDPLKADDAHSDIERNNVNSRYNNTINSRTFDRNTPIIVIGQRLHEDDLCGFLLNGGSGEKWHHLNLPVMI